MLCIFDCDGVLVDSEHVAARVFSLALAETGFTMSAEECLQNFKGMTLAKCYAYIEERFAAPLPSHFPNLLRERSRQTFSEELQAVAGVRELLEFLSERGVEFCVASNGEPDKIAHSLDVCGITHYFPPQKQFSARDVGAGKPAPDLFLAAAESLGVPARFCWVIEDSVPGLCAAEKAEMNCIYFDAHDDRENLHKNISVAQRCTTMDEVGSFFRSLLCN